MLYKSPFSIGDKVYHIANHPRPKWAECPMCKGTKTVTINGETDTCPKCYGRGGKQTWEPEGWNIARGGWQDRESDRYHELGYECLTIDQVRLEHTRDKNPEWMAMCRETGVGSGTLHSMDHMFATVEEAQAECDRLNKRGQE